MGSKLISIFKWIKGLNKALQATYGITQTSSVFTYAIKLMQVYTLLWPRLLRFQFKNCILEA